MEFNPCYDTLIVPTSTTGLDNGTEGGSISVAADPPKHKIPWLLDDPKWMFETFVDKPQQVNRLPERTIRQLIRDSHADKIPDDVLFSEY